MEIIPTQINAYGKNCWGCQHNERDIMIALSSPSTRVIYDVFLTTKQTEKLIKDLQETLEENKK